MVSLVRGARELNRTLACGAYIPSEAMIEGATRAAGRRGRTCFWSPRMMLRAFLRQILDRNCSCRKAVAVTVSESAAADIGLGGPGAGWISGDPSAYAQARDRLPLTWFQHLHRQVADEILRHVHADRSRHGGAPSPRGCGRRVFVIDGSSVSMPDTPSLQKAFPQPSSQKRGCGFPIARLTAIFRHASGALLELAVDTMRVGELPMLRRLIEHFRPGDVIVADRAYHSHADFATWMRAGIDVVVRLQESRCPHLTPLRRLGPNEQIAVWRRPVRQPDAVPTPNGPPRPKRSSSGSCGAASTSADSEADRLS